MIFRIGGFTISFGAKAEIETDRLFSCTDKVKYGSEPTAIKSAEAVSRKHKTELEAYKCRHCDDWHIGHGRYS